MIVQHTFYNSCVKLCFCLVCGEKQDDMRRSNQRQAPLSPEDFILGLIGALLVGGCDACGGKTRVSNIVKSGSSEIIFSWMK